ncbi:S-adenosyl-L-methionine-dependent methyltransferase [Xylariales sp. PMI_506]|nr:S-adenosyl-L-methionine-dependent methyltransferase [Xylariales sp. PMI_506]
MADNDHFSHQHPQDLLIKDDGDDEEGSASYPPVYTPAAYHAAWVLPNHQYEVPHVSTVLSTYNPYEDGPTPDLRYDFRPSPWPQQHQEHQEHHHYGLQHQQLAESADGTFLYFNNHPAADEEAVLPSNYLYPIPPPHNILPSQAWPPFPYDTMVAAQSTVDNPTPAGGVEAPPHTDLRVSHPTHAYYTEEGYYMPSYNLPEELRRIPTGTSTLDVESVVGEFGRTYQNFRDGKYLFPNDGAEQDRLDFQHAAFSILIGGPGTLFLAPVKNPKHALDIATGTGIWAIQLAEQFPEAQVIGTDLSAIQPTNKPDNCTFIRDDAEAEWVFEHKFDFVHLRFVFSCFTDPRATMREAFANMNSGAWIEYQDASIEQVGSMDGPEAIDGSAFQRWSKALIDGTAAAMGRNIEVAPHYKSWLEEVGFVDVEERRLIWPVAPWSGDPRMKLAGAYMQRNFLDGVFLTTWRAIRSSGLSEQEAKELIDAAKAELTNKKNRFYMTAYVVYGRRP